MAELKICPFCGGTPMRGHKNNRLFYVHCKDCGTSTGNDELYLGAEERWNRRIPAAPVEEMEGKYPLVLYFASKADADELTQAVREAFPERVWRKV